MTLRARLALLVGILTAVAAAAVAVVGYRSTADSLAQELDSGLSAAAVRVSEPDGRPSVSVCRDLAQLEVEQDVRIGTALGNQDFNVIQCIDKNGDAWAANRLGVVPVDAADRLLARRQEGKLRFRTIAAKPDDLRVVTVAVPIGAIQFAKALDGNERVLSDLRVKYMLFVGSMSAFGAALGWLFTRQATKPIEALTKAAEQIASTGSLDATVPSHGRDETGRLGRSFSTMLDALRQSRQQQQRLVQDAGHELRTPLTSLRTNVDTLRRHPDLGGEPRARLLADLDSELRELTSLTDELVALASATGNDEPIERVDLAQLATHAVDRIGRRADHHVSLDAEAAPFDGRPRLLQRAIDNLLDNAAKFTPSNGTIDVKVRPGFVQVRDHGPGIAAEDLPHVFDRFYRSVAARSLPGSGLGLAIVSDVVTNHDGHVTVTNHPAGGAIFTIHLPVQRYEGTAPVAPTAGPPIEATGKGLQLPSQ